MGTLAEVAEADEAVRSGGDPPLALLHCVSNYPAAPEDCNLRAMGTLERAFGVPVGWSDHTLGDAVSLAAVALGARILEKHYTLDRDLPGPDHKASLTPEELSAMIARIRAVESALGDGIKRPVEAERDTARVARRSLVAARDIVAGERLTHANLTRKRPGNGIPPKHLSVILGWRAARDLPADTVLDWTDLLP
jgi:N-acetylneuraminate synthase/N,N'-diacetyllegionaminate synthase